ncbi:hypothetical protein [Laribacter hongkongensis]|uniref:Uncharacterized protein n=1 Tax=Laribacter hongkongensis TaxID=168471 RepID=A0ABD4SWU4_9NEIS|nr:hypothetical protein [Laribacter hongkongensis]MCG9027031.1 hypothetical protein [Laribacter hongkongensis]
MNARLEWAGLQIIIAAAVGTGLYLAGYHHARTTGEAELAAYRLEVNEAGRKAAAASLDTERRLSRRAEELGYRLLQEQADHRQTAARLTGEINRVTTQYRPSLAVPLESMPRCVFSTGFVRVWNESAGPAGQPVPAAGDPGAAAGTAGADDALDSGVSQADVLAHRIDSAARCRDIESRLNTLIGFEEARHD